MPLGRESKSLRAKPDFDRCMERIEAWFHQAVIDRPPVRFYGNSGENAAARARRGRSWPDLKSRWFDSEYQIDLFREAIKDEKFLAESFPVFWPNLGPEVYAAFYGGELVYGEATSYYTPSVVDWKDADGLTLRRDNIYFSKIEEMTRWALEICNDEFLVGYTDIHAGVDCAAAWRDPQQFCMDLIVEPDQARSLIKKASADFHAVYEYFDTLLKGHGQPSVTWLGIPSWGKLHIPSCDFASMISEKHFTEFCLPVTVAEVRPMTHNIFHIDGKGVAKNLDLLLTIPEIQAFQYVQGAGDDLPILQWLPALKKIQQAKRSLVIDLQLHELEPIVRQLKPEGVFLFMNIEPEYRPGVIKRLAKW